MATPSMLIVPDRYKSGVLYSQLPESGAVDLDVTRATTAYRTNASGILESVASGVPRLDYPAAGGCPSLLVEPAATNLVLRSEEFDNAYWTKTGGAITANATAAPDGTTTAEEFTEDSANTTHEIRSTAITTAGGIRTFSCFVKKGNARYIQLINLSFGNSNCSAIFDLETKTVTASRADSSSGPVYTFISAKIEEAPNGYLKISLTNSTSSGNTQFIIAHSNAATFAGAILTEGVITYTGDGTSNSFVWGAQVETGRVATSYIPTTTATATRNADVISKTAVSGFIGQSEGTLYAEINVDKLLGIQSRYIFNISDGTADNRIYLAFSGASSNILRARVWSGGVLQATIDTTTISTLGIRKLAMGYANNDVVFYMNGVQIGTDNSASIPACSQVNLGSSQGNLAQINDRIRAAAIYTTRLSNTELASLTSL
jgi:hypothetical protein